MFVKRRRHAQERGLEVAERALRDTVNELHGVVQQHEEVGTLAEEHRAFRRRNHFAESVREQYGARS